MESKRWAWGGGWETFSPSHLSLFLRRLLSAVFHRSALAFGPTRCLYCTYASQMPWVQLSLHRPTFSSEPSSFVSRLSFARYFSITHLNWGWSVDMRKSKVQLMGLNYSEEQNILGNVSSSSSTHVSKTDQRANNVFSWSGQTQLISAPSSDQSLSKQWNATFIFGLNFCCKFSPGGRNAADRTYRHTKSMQKLCRNSFADTYWFSPTGGTSKPSWWKDTHFPQLTTDGREEHRCQFPLIKWASGRPSGYKNVGSDGAKLSTIMKMLKKKRRRRSRQM